MSNVADFVWDRDPDGVALRGASATWTAGDLQRRAAGFAGALAEAGVGRGDRVLLVAPSVPEFAAAYYGILAAGAIAVTANTMSTRRELEYLAADASVSLAVAWHESAEACSAVGVPFWSLAPSPPGGAPLDPVAVDDDDVAVILYTSGTTGRPKGAQLTHGNVRACATAFAEVLEATPADRFGTALPLFHVFGQIVIMGTVMRAGASLSLLERFDAVAMIELLRRDRLTVLAGVPTMWNALLHASDLARPGDFASLRIAASGGASLPVEVLREFEKRLGCVLLEGYGLSETTGAGTFNGLHRERKPGSVGIALPGCSVAVRDDDGAAVGVGEVGEIWIAGPTIMRGYWGQPEATAEVLADGWLRTGDLGTIDEDGDVRIVDRKKDLIIRGGYNVYPREVEEVLYGHPDIVEVAVVGVPHDRLGEEVAAVVVLRDAASLDLEALRAFAKESLSAYKVPRILHVVDELPKGSTGKILKRAIDVRSLAPAM